MTAAKDEETIVTAAKDVETIVTAAEDVETMDVETNVMAAKDVVMITKALTAIKSLAPSSIYQPKKAKKKRIAKLKKGICPDLHDICQISAFYIFSD